MENSTTPRSSVPPKAGLRGPGAEVHSRSGREVDSSTRREARFHSGRLQRVRDVDVGAGASTGTLRGWGRESKCVKGIVLQLEMYVMVPHRYRVVLARFALVRVFQTFTGPGGEGERVPDDEHLLHQRRADNDDVHACDDTGPVFVRGSQVMPFTIN